MSPQPISPELVLSGSEKFLLYGDPKVGKTHCALTLPPPIYYICTGSKDELQTFYSKRFQEKKYVNKLLEKDLLVDYVNLTFNWKLGEVNGYDQVKNLIEKALELEQKGEIHFNSIVIDNITTLTELQIEKAIRLADTSRPAGATGKSTAEKFDQTGVMQVADFEWKDVMNMMQKFLGELLVLNKNFAIIAHEWTQTVSDRGTKQVVEVAIKPSFIGKQRDTMANLFSNIWRIYPSGQLSAARTVGKDKDPNIIAGTRIGGIIPDDYPDPDLSFVINKFKAHAEEMSRKHKSLAAQEK